MMKTKSRTTSLLGILVAAVPFVLLASTLLAQQDAEAPPPAFFGGALPDVEPPPREFSTAEAHYRYLLDAAEGGTRHTLQSIPQWNGLWTSGRNSMVDLFLSGAGFLGLGPGGTVREGVLTRPYEDHFKARRTEVDRYGEQQYDRLTNCEYPGVPRWLWEPYVKEFVNLPHQSWMMNDFMNETRRVFIGQEHVNVDAKHSATGDSIGFWDGDELVIWTKWVNPADYMRGLPLTSNQFEMIERWREIETQGGAPQLVTQVTFYDPLSLERPLSAVYTHNRAPDLEEAGVRIRNWECTTSSNSYKAEDGSTQFYLPGDPEYRDARGTTDFPDLPGQSLDPILEQEAGQ